MSEVLIDLKDIYRSYGDFEALRGVSLKVGKGQIFGFLGPNGSGKTTTIKLILGLIRSSSGSVRIFGEDPYPDDEKAMEVRKHMGSMLEFNSLYENLTGLQNLVFWAELYGMEDQKALQRATFLLNCVNLSKWADLQVVNYSYGMHKRLALARALVCDPDILILDEPTAGVDPESRYMIRNMMKNMAAQGKTIFFSSHDLEEVQKVCSHVAIIRKGKLISKGTLKDVINQFGRPKLFVRLRSQEDAALLAQKLAGSGHDVKVEGPLVSLYPGDNFDRSTLNDETIIDAWKIDSSLEEVYLDLVAAKNMGKQVEI